MNNSETRTQLVDRLAAISSLASIPRDELEWLVAHGQLEEYAAGAIVAPLGKRVEKLWVILSGRISVRVDRGVGPRQVIVWQSGDVTGMLPYSRMTAPPGDNRCGRATELLTVHERYFPQLITRCPVFTAYSVHLMLDRARGFNTSDMQDEKMVSLGKLAAGLAHELNNPASAAMRSAKALHAGLDAVDASWRALCGVDPSDDLFEVVKRARAECQARPAPASMSPLQLAEREESLADWFASHGMDPVLAASLVDTAATIDVLDRLAAATSGETLEAALRWIAATCGSHSLAETIERAATRMYELVAAVKGFTYMDNPAAPESVNVEQGLRDTMTVLAAKTKARSATVTLHADAGLARVRAAGGELNQVWFNLIDNALDAIPDSGEITLRARQEGDRVAVYVVDNGPGIAPDVVNTVFDPFFTTKPPGEGTGLGLDIARRLLRRHHGDIFVTSSPGRTEFRVSLLMDPASST